ncbi:MAG TPA: tRNA 2-selenouridine(34) synthase MnmH [Burkholderiaceae bacterium]|nr:tRNA 2-selenouridine(34) synthase MnmH [Burkholderiaceae bacterium]
MHSTPPTASVDELGSYDALIDVRSPAEFALDHIPGAQNYPVLDNEERARVGTIYQQVSPFAARRLGAALVARNIAQHLERGFEHHPKQWRPLVYCWRGGQRSAAMVLVLNQVGWSARQLRGGYKGFRRRVIADLAQLPPQYRFIVLHGPTGSGKTALLEALTTNGGQVLNLEHLARHRGSVLGGVEPGRAADDLQPGQKAFETQIWQALRQFDPQRVVFVESESRRIGRLSVPSALFEALIGSTCVRLNAPLEARIAHLLERYEPTCRNPLWLRERLEFFVPQHGRKRVEQWRQLLDAGQWEELAREIVCTHYDPAYRRGGDNLYRGASNAQVLEFANLRADAMMQAARALLNTSEMQHAK